MDFLEKMKTRYFAFFLLLVSWHSSQLLSQAPVINWAPSISFCQGNSFVLNAGNPGAVYSWSTGASTQTLTVNTSGTYWVTVSNTYGTASDTIRVYVSQVMNVNLGPDRTICNRGNNVISAPLQPGASYLWQDNSTSPSYTVTQSGQYHVKVTNSCGVYRDTVNLIVIPAPVVNLGPDINNCSPTTNTLSIPPITNGNVIWSTGSQNNSVSVSNPGIYWVKAQNSCGIFTDTIKITLNGGSSLNLGGTIHKCPNNTVTIMANVTGGTYQWNTNHTTQSITVANAGSYWVKYTDNCGTYYDTVLVVNSGKAQVDLGADTAVCTNANFYLDPGYPGSNFVWSTGKSSQTIRVNTAGVYWVGVDNGCGYAFDTIVVTTLVAPDTAALQDTLYYCDSTKVPVTLDAGYWGPQSHYLWDDLSTNQTNSYSQPGYHTVVFGNECDTITFSFYVLAVDPPMFDLGPDTLLCDTLYTLFAAVPRIGNTIVWSTGGSDSILELQNSAWVTLTVTNECGYHTDMVKVDLIYPRGITGGKKVKLCYGGAITLSSLQLPFTKYLWSTNDTTNSIVVNQSGIYTLTMSNQCDTITDTVEVELVYPINLNLGPDTTICAPDVLVLDASMFDTDSLKWSGGSRNGVLPVMRSGTYWVTAYNACGVFRDTISVTVNELPKHLLYDQSICRGSSVVLDVTQPNSTFQWSTGAVTPTITATQQGWYRVFVTNGCGTIKDSCFVRTDITVPPLNLGNDTIFCEGSIILDAGNWGGAQYFWNTGGFSQTLFVNKSGTYWVTKTNACNSISDTIHVLITGPPKLALGHEVRFCTGSFFDLNAQNPGSTYNWNTGAQTQVLRVSTAGLYWVTITNDCGVLTDTVQVIIEFPMDSLDLGADTILCHGTNRILNSGYPDAQARWSNGAIGSSLQIHTGGVYWVELMNSCGVWSDTIEIELIKTPKFSLGPDTVICNIDGSVRLTGPPQMEGYLWSNGDTTASTTFLKAGKKWLTVTNECFSYTDSIVLSGENPISVVLGPDTVLCFGEGLYLDPGLSGYTVHWDNGLISQTREVTRSGHYWARSQNSCGVFADSLRVQFDYPLNLPVSDTSVCEGDTAVFDFSKSTVQITWQDGYSQAQRKIWEPGIYLATLTNQCGSFDKTFEVIQSNCDCPFYVPNVFTPNDDGLNDVFGPIHSCDIYSFEMLIFNRWGQKVFETTSLSHLWQGTMNGEIAPIGTYNFKINYSWKVYGLEIERSKAGRVHLIR